MCVNDVQAEASVNDNNEAQYGSDPIIALQCNA